MVRRIPLHVVHLLTAMICSIRYPFSDIFKWGWDGCYEHRLRLLISICQAPHRL